ncbi:MAG: hypothetical protein COA79_13635 [Planctomycetota bacterium]|nr:MAG: hypothetical protein COA79_13635 [Planctomycetota bacterium]
MKKEDKMKPQSETQFSKKATFLTGLNKLNNICQSLHDSEIDNIVFGKWSAALYTDELLVMGPFVLLIPPFYLNEKKAELDRLLTNHDFKISNESKFIYHRGEHRLMLESQAILSSENQMGRNTVWRESFNMLFKTRSATSILKDYEEAKKPEHEETRKKLRSFIDSRKYVASLAKDVVIDLKEKQRSSATTSSFKKAIMHPTHLINKIIAALETTPYATPRNSIDAIAEIIEATEKKGDARKILNSKRILMTQAICERLNIQSNLLRFVGQQDRHKNFVCLEILLNGEWYLIDTTVSNTTLIQTSVTEYDIYSNSTLQTRGVDCFEVGLGETEQEMQNDGDMSGETIMLPDFE